MKRFLLALLSLMMIGFVSSCKDDDDNTETDAAKYRENKKQGEEFILKKRAEANVVEDPSGLLFLVNEAGNGEKPSAVDTVCITYTGKTIKGTTFVSTTTTIALVDLMEGLRIGVRHMAVGANYTLYAPYYLMFGATPTERTCDGKKIEIVPYSALVYDVQLLSIIKPEGK